MACRKMIYGCDGVGARSLGSRSIVSFEDVNGGKRSHRPFFLPFDDNNNVDEECDEYFYQPEKKRRLAIDQVQFLEKSFEIENKLEPERKVKLAKDLGLQPRQVAIWFQNRRARWKSKQLEKDYDVLQSSYNNLKADYEGLLTEKDKLNAEVLHLREKLLLQQNRNTDSDESDTDKLLKSPSQGPIDQSLSEGENSGNPAEGYKLEDISSAKRDVFEADQSDLSQDEEDYFSKNILAPSLYVFPKIENDHYHDPTTYSGYYGFPVEDQALEFWPY